VQLLRYGVTADDAHRFGLPCGGTVELHLERLGPHSQLPGLIAELEAGRPCLRRVARASGLVQLLPAAPEQPRLQCDDAELAQVFGPPWRLLLIGAGPIAAVLAPLARSLDFEVSVCEPREEALAAFDAGSAQLLRTMPDDAVAAFRPDAASAVVALSHDPKLDDLALMEALRSPAFYVGAIGSRLNQSKRRERLREHFGLDAAQLARLHGPVGLALGARTPAEIAVSVVAELVQVKNTVASAVAAPGNPAPA
jgi:xanthine dehydrogenase accessory factor